MDVSVDIYIYIYIFMCLLRGICLSIFVYGVYSFLCLHMCVAVCVSAGLHAHTVSKIDVIHSLYIIM